MTAILGISIGGRQIGIAVIKNNELIDWKTKTYAGLKKRKRIILILDSIKREVKAHKITHVALKELERFSAVNDLVHEELKSKGRYGFRVKSFYMDDVRRVFGNSRLLGKKDMLGMITHLYPCLLPLLEKEKKNLNPYYTRLFEAVLVSHLCSKEIL